MLQINPNKFFIKQTKSQLTLLIKYTLTSENPCNYSLQGFCISVTSHESLSDNSTLLTYF